MMTATETSPLVSVITAVRNGCMGLPRAIESVRRQSYGNIEYIVVDGASTDGTVDVIQGYTDIIDQWVSEPDKGYADAWNKGLSLASGDLIGFLNHDDWYETDVVERVVKGMNPDEKAVAYGETILVDPDLGRKERIVARYSKENLASGFGFYHTTCFVPRKVYQAVGHFDIRWTFAADTDFLLRCVASGVEFTHTGHTVHMSLGGLSHRNALLAFDEYLEQLRMHCGYTSAQLSRARKKYAWWFRRREFSRKLGLLRSRMMGAWGHARSPDATEGRGAGPNAAPPSSTS